MSEKINKAWEPHDTQEYTNNGRIYDAHACQRYAIALGLEVFDLDIRTMNLDYASPCANDLIDFAKHVQQTTDADLTKPIILNEWGVVIDGKHRLARALIEGLGSIPAVKFDKDPTGVYRLE